MDIRVGDVWRLADEALLIVDKLEAQHVSGPLYDKYGKLLGSSRPSKTALADSADCICKGPKPQGP